MHIINIAICDDSKYLREETKKYLLKYFMQKEFDYSLDEFEIGEALIASNKKYDLIFMDYEFEGKGMDGISVSKILREKGVDSTIIFVTSYSGRVFQSFEVGTFRYLVKPIEESLFFEAMDSFLETMKRDDILIVHAEGRKHFIKKNNIAFIESCGKHSIFHFVCPAKLDHTCRCKSGHGNRQ